jgi:hypothetical protein
MQPIPGSTRRLGLPVAWLILLACAGGDLTLPGDIGQPTDLVLVSGDEQSADPGDELPSPLVVRLVDGQGNGVPAGVVTWVVGTGGGSVSEGTVTTDAEGFASVRLTLGPTPGSNTVSAVVSGLGVVTFAASAMGGNGGGGGGGGDGGGGGGGGGEDDDDDDDGVLLPHHLVFLVQPSDAVEGERIAPAIVVAVVDQNDNVVPDFKIKIELVTAGESVKLGGKRERDTEDGIATFDDLKVEDESDGVVLRALAPEEPFLGVVESRAFRVEDD